MGLNQTWNLSHSEENDKFKKIYEIGKNTCKWYNW